MSTGAAQPARPQGALTRAAEGGASNAAQRPLDVRALSRHAVRVAARPAPWLHEEVARRMAERLAVLRRPPRHIVDWGARAGGSEMALRRACPQAERLAVECFDVGSLAASGPARPSAWWPPRRWWRAANVAAPHESTLPDGAADLLWSNMILHHLPDPLPGMARWLRLLREQGLLMFSTLGPGTLASLRQLYAAHGWASPFAAFVDMHDLGDMLVQAGFADPVMDQEVLTLTWATPGEALAELRQLGGNADPGRHAGLRTPRWRERLERALRQAAGADGERVALSFEVVYGHAVRPPPRVRVGAEAQVPLAQIRRMLRTRPGAEGAGPAPPPAPEGPTR